MAELLIQDVVKIPILSMQDWAKKYADGVTNSAIAYLLDEGVIDFIKVGRQRVIVLTPKTLEYVPNSNTKRRAILRT